jgi:hypothetical protein
MNLKIENAPNFVRDSSTGAIINTDVDSYTIALNRKKKLTEQQEKITELQSQLDELLQWKQQIVELLENNNR